MRTNFDAGAVLGAFSDALARALPGGEGRILTGTAAFEPLRAFLRPCAQTVRIPEGARGVLVAAFPYSSGTRGNLARYASAEDYHRVVGDALAAACAALAGRYPAERFAPFCDDSPVPEVAAAIRAGLGLRARSNLLATDRFGTFVFLGEIVTTIPLPDARDAGDPRPAAEASLAPACASCGLCTRACPGSALGAEGFCRARCSSSISQKRGALTGAEQAILRKSGYLWGCDICQIACPINKNARPTSIERFLRNVRPNLTVSQLDDPDFAKTHADRAYLWRGAEVLRRNARILGGKAADTKSAGD